MKSETQKILSAQMTIGGQVFHARLRRDLAPDSCARLETLLPYHGKIIHARWSGEAFWSPLTAVWPPGLILPPENAICQPGPGEVLLFAGGLSEPERHFASTAGPPAGNPVLTIDDRPSQLAEFGRTILWHGAVDFRIEIPYPNE